MLYTINYTCYSQLRIRLNAVQNAKIQSQEEALKEKLRILAEKKEELRLLTLAVEEVCNKTFIDTITYTIEKYHG